RNDVRLPEAPRLARVARWWKLCDEARHRDNGRQIVSSVTARGKGSRMPLAGEIDPRGARKDALDAFLEEKIAEGFTIETHTDTHAIITEAGRRFWSRLHLRAPRRYVVQVDESGGVTMSAAEPRRS